MGVDSCAGVSVSPPGVFPGPVKPGPRVGEIYAAANGTSLVNEGEQDVSAYTENWHPVNGKVQVTQVTRPLFSVFEMKKAGNSVLYSDVWGDIIINNKIISTNFSGKY